VGDKAEALRKEVSRKMRLIHFQHQLLDDIQIAAQQ
jgi:hypothetical protein